jgi:hypothetical protein
MQYFLKKSALFLTIGILCAWLLQCLIDEGLQKSGYSADYKVWYEIMHSRVNTDILIQGSSTARIQISPKSLENQFHLSAYNIGINGATFPFEYYKFSMFIKHDNKPKYLIQVVDANTLTNAIDVDFVQFIPYLNAGLVNRFRNHFIFTDYDVYIPLYKYSHRVGAVSAALDHLFDRDVQNTGDYNGFKAYDEHYHKKKMDSLLEKPHSGFYAPYNDTVYRQFIGFINYCKKSDIKLIIVYPPAQAFYTNHLLNKDSVSGWYDKIAKKYDIPFFDYSNLPISKDTSMYLDYFHLNAKGVKRLNELFVNDLKSVIK